MGPPTGYWQNTHFGRGPLAQCQVGRVGVIWDCHSVTTAPPIPDPSDTGQDIRIE
uniref:Uncharacterized protein n=1 Tax=Anguilla anguilla TaxID=7936 RepID=A0A0E9S290_ANGAN